MNWLFANFMKISVTVGIKERISTRMLLPVRLANPFRHCLRRQTCFQTRVCSMPGAVQDMLLDVHPNWERLAKEWISRRK